MAPISSKTSHQSGSASFPALFLRRPKSAIAPTKAIDGVKDVFCNNLEDEMQVISRIMTKYPYVALDTEFPGVLGLPSGVFNTQAEYEYAVFKGNVDRMKIIQLGLSFFDERGNRPSPIHTWQFNFRYNLHEEVFAEDSIKMLIDCGIDFERNQFVGIEPNHFAERMLTSGLVCTDEVHFLTFHSAYDFGYLFKVLEGTEYLPPTEAEFLDVLRMYFPKIYDIKYMIKDFPSLKGGLQDLANYFGLTRVGNQHQAGSDSALTGLLFFRLKMDTLPKDLSPLIGKIYGLSGSFPVEKVFHLDNVVIREKHDESILGKLVSSLDTTPYSWESVAAYAESLDYDGVYGNGKQDGGNCPGAYQLTPASSFASSHAYPTVTGHRFQNNRPYVSHNGTVYFA